MNKLRLFAASAGIFFTLSQPMLANATPPPVEPQCFAPPALEKLQDAPATLRPKWMREVLLAPATGKCASKWLFPAGGASSDLPILINLMRSDEVASVRAQAADALGWVGIDRKTIMEALSGQLNSERDAAVVLARIHSINMQLNDNWYDKWDESIRLDDLVNRLRMQFNDSARTASENEAILAAVGEVASKLTGAPYTRPGKLETHHAEWLTENLASLIHDFTNRFPGQAAPLSAWRANIFDNLATSLQEGHIVFAPKVHVRTMLAVAKRMDDPLPQVRAASLRLMVQVIDKLDGQADKAWQDYSPYLSTWRIEQLVQAAAAAARDQDAHVREAAVVLIGQLTQRSGGQDASLVAALNDPSIAVRKAAALALARKNSMPKEAVARLLELARQEDEDSPHAIIALSKVGTQRVMDVLIEILLSAADTELRAKEVPPHEPMPSWEWRPPERWLGPRELAKARTEAAARALDKFGAKVLPTLLKHASEAGTENARARMYSVMVDAGWPSSAPGMEVSEAALAPAILGEDESSRLFALSLLAAQPMQGKHRYSNSLVDAMFKRYLQDKPKKMTREEANPSTFMFVAGNPAPLHWNTDWRMKPQLASSVIAGGSDSKFAAERMVAYICADHRLELGETGDLIASWGGSPLSNEMDVTNAMRASLERMGDIPKPYKERALAKQSATMLCKWAFDKNFVPPEE